MTRWFCDNKDIGHPHSIKLVGIFDMNNDVASKFIFDESWIAGKYTVNFKTQQPQKYNT